MSSEDSARRWGRLWGGTRARERFEGRELVGRCGQDPRLARWRRDALRSPLRPIVRSLDRLTVRPPHLPSRLRLDPDLARLSPEAAAVVHRQPASPPATGAPSRAARCARPRTSGWRSDVAAADGDLGRPAGAEIHRQLAEPGAHPARQPDRDGAERAAEVLDVEPLVERREALQQREVAGPRPLRRRAGRGGGAYCSTGKPRNSRSAQSAQRPREAADSRNRTIARSTRSGALA